METGVASPSLERPQRAPLPLPPSFTLFSFLLLPRSPSDPVQPSQASTAPGTKEAVMGTEGREEGPEQTMPVSQGRAGRGGACTAAKGLDPPENSGAVKGLQEGTRLCQGCWHKWGG